MNEKKKQDKAKQFLDHRNTNPEKVLQCGAITASVFLRVTNTGFQYRDYLIGRFWLNASGKESRASSFFIEHEDDIHAAVRQAVAYIREKENRAVEQTATPAPALPGQGN